MTRKNSTTSGPDGDPDCTELLEDDSRSILMGIIAQLGKGTDLHRVTLPTFVLEPRSMLERITDFMSHPELLLEATTHTDPLERFIGVVRFFLSGWHIKPKGVKKPYNPVLGEIFRSRWRYANGTEAIYVAEQVSHHPPISAYHYASPENGVTIQGNLRPKPKFLGNSAATLMEGFSTITMARWDDEKYCITMPNVYARGILFGKMIMELGDSCYVKCPENGFVCELDFKTKGFFSGQYNVVTGKIKNEATGQVLKEISGTWSNELFISPPKSSKKQSLFDVKKSMIHPMIVEHEHRQEDQESRRLWAKVTDAIKRQDMDVATDEKMSIEDRQRAEAKERQKQDNQFESRYFVLNSANEYVLKASSSGDAVGSAGDDGATTTTIANLDAFVFGSSSVKGNPSSTNNN
ncbi:hypothetical protein BDB00DRAFT_860179 [Zychaea mexicana]|uniref:uncharacterized protein n=1 Tax=Zychaea mexicana TaxID=64656 RepID=UPI0022FE462B|nr:uncharacterized protein BDB00DRAFT_860179 [Zychaea mexicana]KAI9474839.1 hypothetical protein BDB00DRAFT_860179 [Zychaea mexicana]